jgi:hypothetical protein
LGPKKQSKDFEIRGVKVMPGKICQVCKSKFLVEVNNDLLQQHLSAFQIAEKYGFPNKYAIIRHFKFHLPASIVQQNATKQKEHVRKEMVSAWDRFVNLYDEIISVLGDAKKKKDLSARIASLKELREHIKLELDVRTASFQKEINKEAGQKAALIFNSLETIKRINDNPELKQLLQEGLAELAGKSFEHIKVDPDKCYYCGHPIQPELEGDPEILNRRR